MKTPIIRVSLGFTSKPDDTFLTFCRNIRALLYVAGGLPNPPVSAEDLSLEIEALSGAKAAQPSGGKAATAVKDNCRETLTVSMRKLALFVQDAAENNLAVILAVGFEAVSTNRARYPLSKPMILRIATGMSSEALVTLSTERVARGCEVQVAEIGPDGAPGEFRPIVFSTSSRNVLIAALTPGLLYAYRGRTVGGSTTYSDWSDLVVQRAA